MTRPTLAGARPSPPDRCRITGNDHGLGRYTVPATTDTRPDTTIGSLLRDSLVYALGVLLSRLVGFIMIPVYTRVLTPADYAVLETISRLVDVFGLILSL